MASPAPSERMFDRLNHVAHEKPESSTVKISHSLSTIFCGDRYDREDQQRVLAAFEANGEKSCSGASDRLEDIVYDKGREGVNVYLLLSGADSQSTSGWSQFMRMVQFVSIPDSVEEISEGCFCKDLSRVTFGASSSLKLIQKGAFCGSGLVEIHIPDGVEELCEKCFADCKSLSRVTFGESSSLKLIGKGAFHGSRLSCFWLPGNVSTIGGSSFSGCPLKNFVISGINHFFDAFDGLLVRKGKRACCSCIGSVKEVIIPDSVEELCDWCFSSCKSLSHVTFGKSSSLKLVGKNTFSFCGLSEIHLPDSVEELCDSCFFSCESLSHVTFGKSSSLKLVGKNAFSFCGLSEIHLPDSVEELCDSCFTWCESLSHVTFGKSSSLKRISAKAFCGSGLSSFALPASVVSIGGGSFSECPLRYFVICDKSSLFSIDGHLLLSRDRRVLYGCLCKLTEVLIPDSVEELCDSCFTWCESLSHVTFGKSSS